MQEVLEYIAKVTFGLLHPTKAERTTFNSLNYSVESFVDIYVDGVFMWNMYLWQVSLVCPWRLRHHEDVCKGNCEFWGEGLRGRTRDLNRIRKTGSLLQIKQDVPMLTTLTPNIWSKWSTAFLCPDELPIGAYFEEFKDEEFQAVCRKHLNTSTR